MAVGLYKPGQGYWVRVLTAAFIGVLTLAAAGWVMGQMNLLAQSLPPTDWLLTVKSSGELRVPPQGEQVTLLGAADGSSGQFPAIGSAKIVAYNPDDSTLRVTDIKMNSEQSDPSIAKAVEGGVAGGLSAETAKPSFFVELPGPPQPKKAIEPVVLEGIGAAVVILAGTVFAYLFAGTNRKTSEFLIATDLEMKKVNWSTRHHILSSTWVVIGASFLIAGFLYGTDALLFFVFRTMGVLQ